MPDNQWISRVRTAGVLRFERGSTVSAGTWSTVIASSLRWVMFTLRPPFNTNHWRLFELFAGIAIVAIGQWPPVGSFLATAICGARGVVVGVDVQHLRCRLDTGEMLSTPISPLVCELMHPMEGFIALTKKVTALATAR